MKPIDLAPSAPQSAPQSGPEPAPLQPLGQAFGNPGAGPENLAGGCGCKSGPAPDFTPAQWGLLGLSAVVWAVLYFNLPGLAARLTSALSSAFGGMDPRLAAALEFFIYDGPKVLLLLCAAVFGIGVVRSFFTPERSRALLAGKREFAGNIAAACLGVLTPFCSCSAVPLFLGFMAAGVPLGVTFSFLIASPMVNEIALALLVGMFGWKIALAYAGFGLTIAIAAGWTLGRMKMENHLEDWVRFARLDPASADRRQTWSDRVRFGLAATREIVGKTWPWILMGIAVGAGVHGYVPEGGLAGWLGKENWYSVPLAVVIGVPLYANAAGVIPVVSALLEKGVALGTALAFMMSVIALSLPEMIILRKALKPRLLGAFVGVTAAGILLVGWLFNLLL